MGKLIETNTDDNNTIEVLRLISEQDTFSIENIFEAFCFYFALCYAGDEEIYIPYIGTIKINKNNNSIQFIPHRNLEKTISQLQKAEKSGIIMDIDLVKMFQNRIKLNLKNQDCVKNIL